MDWIRKNKFLAGFIAVLLVGVGALGYLLYSEMDAYDQTSQQYDTAVTELGRLQGLKPFPFQKSKTELVKLRGETAERVANLQKQLADYAPPAEQQDFNPGAFQDKLRRVVEETVQSANAANVKLPAEFYMGFEQYRSTPPRAPAAPLLSRQLDVIQDLLRILIARKIDTLTAIKRAPLPQELGDANPTATPPPRAGANNAPALPADAVTRQTVEISFSGQTSAFQDTLNDLVTSKQLFLVRAIQVKNQKPKGPPRESASVTGATPPPGAPPAPGTIAEPNAVTPPAPDKPALEYVVGLEKIDVDMRVEIVKVAAPAAPAATPAPATPRAR